MVTIENTTGLTAPRRSGFSLIELVIVVVIIGIIGAIAIPRMSRGSEGASVSALVGNLAVLNKAVDLYAAEHQGDFPQAANIASQLTGETIGTGATFASQPGELAYGPYLRDIPPLPVGEKKGNTGIALADGVGVGWLYAPTKGIVRPNLTKIGGVINEPLVTIVISGSNLIRGDLVKP